MATRAEGRRGRPPVGTRTEVTTRVRPELHNAMVAVAKARGVTMTKFLETAIERELGIQATGADQANGLRMGVA